MKVTILNEAGYDEALLGLSLSYNKLIHEMPAIAEKLYYKGDEESKFLRQIIVWLDVVAPRYWWQEMDTYCVGMTKQSGSTMHTILKRTLNNSDFALPLGSDVLAYLNDCIDKGLFEFVKNDLPEGFLQRRILCTNYQTIRRIIKQRCTHRLEEWHIFIESLMNQLQYQEFIQDLIPIEL